MRKRINASIARAIEHELNNTTKKQQDIARFYKLSPSSISNIKHFGFTYRGNYATINPRLKRKQKQENRQEKTQAQPNKFIPDEGCTFYYVTGLQAKEWIYRYKNFTSTVCASLGNCYETMEEAQNAIEQWQAWIEIQNKKVKQ